MRIPRALLMVCVALLLPLIAFAGGEDEAGDVIKVGVLHSLSGTMSISEVAVKDATRAFCRNSGALMRNWGVKTRGLICRGCTSSNTPSGRQWRLTRPEFAV